METAFFSFFAKDKCKIVCSLLNVCACSVAKSCPNSLQPHGLCSAPSSSVYGILQARILEWIAFPFSRGSSWPRDWTQVSCIAGGFFTIWTTREASCCNVDAYKVFLKKSKELWDKFNKSECQFKIQLSSKYVLKREKMDRREEAKWKNERKRKRNPRNEKWELNRRREAGVRLLKLQQKSFNNTVLEAKMSILQALADLVSGEVLSSEDS